MTTILAWILCFSNALAQQSLNAAGGNASGSGGSASYSVGQVFYQTHTGENALVAAGVQQPYEISVVTSIEEATGINLSVRIYPNPASYCLTLEIEEYNPFTPVTGKSAGLGYQLLDMNGRCIREGITSGSHTRILVDHLPSSTYLLKITRGNTEIKTFRIIKN
jgi:hypothetical protein